MSAVDLGDFMIGFGPADHAGSQFVDLTIIGRADRFLK
jgi:hypothetical protein